MPMSTPTSERQQLLHEGRKNKALSQNKNTKSQNICVLGYGELSNIFKILSFSRVLGVLKTASETNLVCVYELSLLAVVHSYILKSSPVLP